MSNKEIKVKREETVDGKTLKRIELPQGGLGGLVEFPELISPQSFISPNCTIIGRVEVEAGATIMDNSKIEGEGFISSKAVIQGTKIKGTVNIIGAAVLQGCLFEGEINLMGSEIKDEAICIRKSDIMGDVYIKEGVRLNKCKFEANLEVKPTVELIKTEIINDGGTCGVVGTNSLRNLQKYTLDSTNMFNKNVTENEND